MGKLEPRREIVQSTVGVGTVTTITAFSGTGKGFVVLDMAGSVANGQPWLDRGTTEGSVIVVNYEADDIDRRLTALFQHRKQQHPEFSNDNIYTVRGFNPLNNSDKGDHPHAQGFEELLVTINEINANVAKRSAPPVRLLIIDTVRSSLAGNENDSAIMAAYHAVVRELLEELPYAGVVLLHHTGWPEGGKQRERGSSEIRGNTEYAVFLTTSKTGGTDGAELMLSWPKCRDELRPMDRRLLRKVWIIDNEEGSPQLNQWGEPLTSCVIVEDTRTAEQINNAERAEVNAQADKLEQAVLKVVDTNVITTKRAVGKLIPSMDPTLGALGQKDGENKLKAAIAEGLVKEPKRGHPFVLTEKGLAVLELNAGGAS